MNTRYPRAKGRLRKVLPALLVVLGAVFIFQVIPALAQSRFGLEYGTLTGLGTTDIRVSVMRIVRIALGFLGILAILIILYAGFVWMTSGGNEEKIETAKRTLRNAAIGLLIIFLAYAIVSFIINALVGTFGQPPTGGPPGGCVNCDHLGSGIIESVYPVPGQTNVARNTNIMVTFKVEMDPRTIIVNNGMDDCSSADDTSCSGKLQAGNVIIKFPGPSGEVILGQNDVDVSTTNGRTYVFNPVNLLGNSDTDTWHNVRLTSGIARDNGTTAFPGARGFFEWNFQVGTYLDLDPVEVSNVFPPPDNATDVYTLVAATFAGGVIRVTNVPRVAQSASVDTSSYALTPYPPNNPRLVIGAGTYNGTFRGTARFDVDYGASTVTITYPAGNPHPTNGSSRTFTLANNAFTYGDGLIFRVENPSSGGDSWNVTFTPLTVADTLQVGSVTFTFVAGTAGANQIQVGSDAAGTAQNIESVINASSVVPVRVSFRSGSVLELTAKTAGTEGNFIPLLASQSGGRAWAEITPMSGGAEPSFQPSRHSAPDQPRNAIFKINFNETLTPSDLANTIAVQREVTPGSWQDVQFVAQISNLYRTVELLSTQECLDETTGQPIENSCGDKIYCWPFNNPTPYAATHYRVTVKTGLLKDCSAAGASCPDSNYGTCLATGNGSVCSGTTPAPENLVYYYPESRTVAQGIVDAANNSLNGNRDTYTLGNQTLGRAQGPQAQSGQGPFELNKVCQGTSDRCLNDADCGGLSCVFQPASQGDDLVWEFFINKNLDLTPPDITSVGPAILSTGTHLTLPSETQFDKLMSEATFKPGANYADGYCSCSSMVCSGDHTTACKNNSECATAGGNCNEFADPNDSPSQGSCDTGQLCKIRAGSVGRCVNNGSAQEFCLEDKECRGFDDPANGIGGGTVTQCKNRKYFSLLDRATAKVAYWITADNTDLNFDTYADVSAGQLQHTRFVPLTDYATEIGSGVKDVYQNCYLPSQGPNLAIGGRCSLTATLLCNGDRECPSGERCLQIATKYCYSGTTPGQQCQIDSQCNSGETCKLDPTVACLTAADLTANPPRGFCCNGVALDEATWKATPACATAY